MSISFVTPWLSFVYNADVYLFVVDLYISTIPIIFDSSVTTAMIFYTVFAILLFLSLAIAGFVCSWVHCGRVHCGDGKLVTMEENHNTNIMCPAL